MVDFRQVLVYFKEVIIEFGQVMIEFEQMMVDLEGMNEWLNSGRQPFSLGWRWLNQGKW